MEREKIVIGSRGSKLAMIYAENVKAKLAEVFFKDIEIKKIVTYITENPPRHLVRSGFWSGIGPSGQ